MVSISTFYRLSGKSCWWWKKWCLLVTLQGFLWRLPGVQTYFLFFAHVFPLMKCNILVPIHFDKSRYIEHKVFIHTYIHMFIKNNIEDMCQQLLFPSQRTMAAERNALPKCCRYLLLMMWLVLWANVAQYQFLCYSCFSVSNRLCKLTYIQTHIRTFIHVRVKGYFCLAFFRNTVKWYLRGFFHSISFWFIHSFVRSFSALHYDVMMSVVDINFHNDDQTTIKKPATV